MRSSGCSDDPLAMAIEGGARRSRSHPLKLSNKRKSRTASSYCSGPGGIVGAPMRGRAARPTASQSSRRPATSAARSAEGLVSTEAVTTCAVYAVRRGLRDERLAAAYAFLAPCRSALRLPQHADLVAVADREPDDAVSRDGKRREAALGGMWQDARLAPGFAFVLRLNRVANSLVGGAGARLR